MFKLIKQGLNILLSFSASVVTKCVSLNDEAYLARPTLIYLNPS